MRSYDVGMITECNQKIKFLPSKRAELFTIIQVPWINIAFAHQYFESTKSVNPFNSFVALKWIFILMDSYFSCTGPIALFEKNVPSWNFYYYVLLQISHSYGRSSVCAGICFFNLLAVANALPHWSQIADLNTEKDQSKFKISLIFSNHTKCYFSMEIIFLTSDMEFQMLLQRLMRL